MLVVIREPALQEMIEYAEADTSQERGGVLVGRLERAAGGSAVVMVEGWIPAQHTVSTRASLTFTAETWAAISEELESRFPKSRIVGWYHTHPNFGVFLSQYDLFIHRHFFTEPWQVALVVDPIRGERGFFAWTKQGQIEAIPFCILVPARRDPLQPVADFDPGARVSDSDSVRRVEAHRAHALWNAPSLTLSVLQVMLLILLSGMVGLAVASAVSAFFGMR